MSRSLYLMRIVAVLAPSPKVATEGCLKHRAVIVGHVVRMAKLYNGFYMHVAERQLELAEVFIRPIHETAIRMSYFLKAGHQRRAIRSFIFASYKAERQSIRDLKGKQSQRPLIPIEKRMLRSMMRNIREDGITFKELDANREWKVDGKDVASMLRHLGRDWEYSYGFGSGSRHIHGNWMDIKCRHLRRNGARYHPKITFSDPDARTAAPVTIEVLATTVDYLHWSKADPDDFVTKVITGLVKYVRGLDRHHEEYFMQGR